MTRPQFPLQLVQQSLNSLEEPVDGWLIYNFRKSNPFAYELLYLAPNEHITRRFFYWIPKKGDPIKIVHTIEPHIVKHLPGNLLTYSSWKELETIMKRVLKRHKLVSMEYSHKNYLPSLSRIDAGTVEWLDSFGVSVTSSWPILEQWISRWTNEQKNFHLEAARVVNQAMDSSFSFIKERLSKKKKITELDVQKHIQDIFLAEGCITSHPPICAINDHAAIPHYAPTEESDREIKKGDLILVDAWCKKDHPRAPFADFTRVALAASKVDPKIEKLYNIVRKAQKKACDFIQKKLSNNEPVFGYEVDDVARKYIASLGYADYFPHRTGHNIHTTVHGHGAHLDNFETHDTRRLMPGTCFSIEPGIYLPQEFGIRLECNGFITHDNTLEITGESTDELPLLFSKH